MLARSPLIQNLEKARNLIVDKDRWCEGGLRDELGRHCAIGAYNEVAGTQGYREVPDALVKAAVNMVDEAGLNRWDAGFGFHAVYMVNDQLGHEATLRMFERAIEIAIQEGVSEYAS